MTVAEGVIASFTHMAHRTASMGPQLDSCGRAGAERRLTARSRLQWGRNLTVAEGFEMDFGQCLGQTASMGPQLDSCGRHPMANKAVEAGTGFNGAAT